MGWGRGGGAGERVGADVNIIPLLCQHLCVYITSSLMRCGTNILWFGRVFAIISGLIDAQLEAIAAVG